MSFKMKTITSSLVLLLTLVSTALLSQQLAFPGAEGGGRFALGGRGGTVYEVTNLNDNGPGSLRDAISAPNRTVVFRVSGIIHLASRLSIKQSNITIAGQTAPGDGIMITGNTVNVSASNIIIRYIRCRLADATDIVDDAMNSFSSDINFPYHDNIIDHCSLGWSVDETGSFYGNKNFTLQWCLLTESLYNSVHNKGVHGYGGIWGGYNATFHHNLLAHHSSRNPRFCGSRYTGHPDMEVVDFRNNVLYNWGNINSAYGGEGGNYNMVNNYYKPGPATAGNLTTSSSSNKRNRILNYTSYYYSTDAAVYPDTLFGGKFYIDGNVVEGYPDVSADNWTLGVQKDGYYKADSLIQAARQANAFTTDPVTTQPATDAYQSVLQSVGAILPHRDALDNRVVNEAHNGTASYEGATYGAINSTGISHPSGIIDTQDDVGGFPTYSSATAPIDSDHDGMPDSWETANGLNPNDASDANGIATNGYTNLENYLNSISSSGAVNSTPTLMLNGVVTAFSQTVGSPSATQKITIAGNNLGSTVSIMAPAGFEISRDSITWYNNGTSLIVSPVNGVMTTTKILVRLNASVAGTYSGDILESSIGAQAVTLAISGNTNPATPAAGASIILQKWPMSAGNTDDDLSRSAGVISSTSTFSKLTSSNGTTVSTIKAYSATTGQAFAATADGYWTTTMGGPGGNLNRTDYEQFTVTASSNYNLRLDSILLNSAFYASSSNTKLAIGYSTTGFKSDSTDIPGATFASPTILTQDNTGPNPKYSFAISGTTGINLNAGQVLTIRLYFSCGSTSSGRYGMMKNVIIKGVANAIASTPTLSVNSNFNSFSQTTGTPSDAQTFTVAGNNLTSNITITPPAGYELSTDGSTFTSTGISLAQANGSVASTTLSIRLNAGSPQTYAGNVTVTSAGATDVTIAVTGTASSSSVINYSGTLSNFTQTIGAPSATQNFIVSGNNLTSNVNVTPPAGYEISTDGNSWYSSAAPLSLTPSAGTLASTSISVRLNANTAASYSGNIALASPGASTKNLVTTGMSFSPTPYNYDASNANTVVAKDGSGNYTTIQEAINAAPANSTTPWIIYIRNGKYVEKVNIPSNKPFIHLVGQSVANTIISWDSYSGKIENGVTIGTSTSATLTVNANDFYMMSITVENASGYIGDGPQALALLVNGDRCVYKNCRFISGQDTIWHNGDGKRHYFKNCYIDGNTDFIFGGSTAVFDSCVIFPRDRIDGGTGGYVTAANTSAGYPYGEIFRDCRLTMNRGITKYYLGRPWQNDAGTTNKKNNKTVYLNTMMGASIYPAGWTTWDAGTNTSLITYAEYKSLQFDNTPVDVSQRVSWSKQLSDTAAVVYYNNSTVFTNWDPCSADPSVCTILPSELVVSNFRAQRGASSSTLSWNISWPMANVTYELYRSTDSINYTKINQVIGSSESIVAFSLTDPAPQKGTIYYYYVKAIKSNYPDYYTYIAVVDPSQPLDGEFRSAGNGYWANASTGNGSNISSIWEKYVASSHSWILQPLGTQPNSVNVTIRQGHTVILDGLKNANNLVIETGAVLKSNGGYGSSPAVQTLRIGAGAAASVVLQNDGTFGGSGDPDDLILIEWNTACANVKWTGAGTTQISRIRPLPANPNALSVVFEQDIKLVYNSGAFTAYYNSSSNSSSENVTYTINPGKTIALTNPSGSFSPEGSTTSNPGGNYTYNINGSLDLSTTTTNSNVVPFSTNGSSVVAVNVGPQGVLKLGTGFNTVNSAPSSSNGKVVLTIADGGLVDATNTTNLNLGTNYFVSTGNGILKRRVAAMATFFPIGTALSYTPATITNSGTADNFSLNVKDNFDPAPADPSRVVNKQWNIAADYNGGSILTLKLGWLSSDQPAGFDPAAFVGINSLNTDGTLTDNRATVSGSGTAADPYFATVSGLTAPSTFVVANIRIAPSISLNGGSYTYDGNKHAASGYAYGVNGDVLNPALAFSYSGINGSTYGPTDAAPVNAGNYKVVASFAGNTDYKAAIDSSTIIINPASLTVNADTVTKTYGNADPVLTYSLTSGSLVTGDNFSGDLSREAGESVGTYLILQNTLSAGANYTITYNTGSLFITPRTLKITASDRNRECGDSISLGNSAFTSDGLVPGDSIDSVRFSSDGISAGVGNYAIVPSNASGSALLNYDIQYINGTLVVRDTKAPLPDAATLPDITGECSATISIIPTATDGCTGSINATTTDPLTYNQQGTYNIMWTFTDASGNSSNQTQKVIVKDVTSPVITYTPVVPVQCYNPGANYTVPSLTATDNCNTVNINYSITGATTRSGHGDASGSFNIGSSTITWTVDDGHGNQSTAQTLVVVNAPLLTSIPDVFAVTPGGAANTIYIGYGPTSVSLYGQASGGTAPYSYKWTTGSSAGRGISSTPDFTVSPTTTSVYYFNVTDVYSCAATVVTKTINVVDVRCGAKLDRVTVCTVQNGKNTSSCLTQAQVASELSKGGTLGSCTPAALPNTLVQDQLAGAFVATVAPNPSSDNFTLRFRSSSSEVISIRVLDVYGRLMESRTGISVDKAISIGTNYLPGIYFAEVLQGNERQVLKLVKQSN
jgi:pectin methylesterase-like acyl-CoA thioesterase